MLFRSVSQSRYAAVGRCGVEEVGDELGSEPDGAGGSGYFEISALGDEVCGRCAANLGIERGDRGGEGVEHRGVRSVCERGFGQGQAGIEQTGTNGNEGGGVNGAKLDECLMPVF